MFSVPFKLSEEITIDANPEKCMPFLNDFNKWRVWSPWFILEPSAKLTIEGEAGKPLHSQSWVGNRIGSGQTVLKAVTGNHRLDFDLVFLKPWKSQSKTAFELKQQGNTTIVKWSMESTLPVFLFFLKKLMIGLVGNDYRRGLKMLKSLVESGNIHSKIVEKGIVTKPAFTVCGIRRTCALSEIGKLMPQDIGAVAQFFGKNNLKPKSCYSFYPVFDFSTGTCTYITGFEGEFPSQMNLPEGFEIVNHPQHRALEVEHFGPYDFIGNAWSFVMSVQRNDKHKLKKNLAPYETYFEMPGQVPDDKIRTTITLPIK